MPSSTLNQSVLIISFVPLDEKTLQELACIAAYTAASSIFVEHKTRKPSACLTPVGTSGSFFRTRLCCVCLSCLVSHGWAQSLSFLYIKELILAGLQAVLRGCCPRLVRGSSAPALSLQTVCYHHWTRQFLHCTSLSCFTSFCTSTQLLKGLQSKNSHRSFKRKPSELQPPLQSWIQLQLSWFFMD